MKSSQECQWNYETVEIDAQNGDAEFADEPVREFNNLMTRICATKCAAKAGCEEWSYSSSLQAESKNGCRLALSKKGCCGMESAMLPTEPGENGEYGGGLLWAEAKKEVQAKCPNVDHIPDEDPNLAENNTNAAGGTDDIPTNPETPDITCEDVEGCSAVTDGQSFQVDE